MDQSYVDLLGAIARQAVHDLHTGYTHPRHMDAGAWLEAAGLLGLARQSPPRKKRTATRTQLPPHGGGVHAPSV